MCEAKIIFRLLFISYMQVPEPIVPWVCPFNKPSYFLQKNVFLAFCLFLTPLSLVLHVRYIAWFWLFPVMPLWRQIPCQGICTVFLSWICSGILAIGHCHLSTALLIAAITIFISWIHVNLKKHNIYWLQYKLRRICKING